MTMSLSESLVQTQIRTAGHIRAWIVSELARLMKVDPGTIDTRAPLDSLGADSLTALGMTGALAAWLDRDLPATLMWDYGSIDGLAEGLADADVKPEDVAMSGVVRLQQREDGRPLFCFPGLGGHPACFAAAASHLRDTCPCFGLTVPGLNGEQPPLTRLEDIAAVMLRNLRRVQPRGPYQLAGYSFGGLLAFETAQQLVAAGETVSTLAIFDTFTGPGRVQRPYWQRLPLHAWLLLTRRREYIQHVRGRLKRLRVKRRRAREKSPVPAPMSPTEQRGQAVWIADRTAAYSYYPQSYPGSVVVIRARDRSIDNRFWKIDESNGWAALAQGGVQIVDAPGDHGNMLFAENAPTAAAALRPFLAG